MELIFKFPPPYAGAPFTSASWVPCLNHEVLDVSAQTMHMHHHDKSNTSQEYK